MVAQAAALGAMDTDGDGVVSEAEFVQAMERQAVEDGDAGNDDAGKLSKHAAEVFCAKLVSCIEYQVLLVLYFLYMHEYSKATQLSC